MSAEFVIVLPAVVAVLLLAIGAVLLAAHRVTLTSAAAEVARLEARGDEAMGAARLAALGNAEQISVSRERRGALHCVELSSRPGTGLLASIRITATACAAAVADVAGRPPP